MYGPEILSRFLSDEGPPDKNGVSWQYHSRSDRHSKVGCWGVAFDLLSKSSLLRAHARDGKVVLGVNHEMRDFSTGRKKDLDLVVARPDGPVPPTGPSFKSLAQRYGVELTSNERHELDSLPDIPVASVGAVLIALEAKATMTAHVKSLPRLYDELNSSHLCVHGASRQALAIAYVQINRADSFVSPIINSERIMEGLPIRVTAHKQPADTIRVLEKVAEIPRRQSNTSNGFDAIGITVVDLRNDGLVGHGRRRPARTGRGRQLPLREHDRADGERVRHHLLVDLTLGVPLSACPSRRAGRQAHPERSG